MQIEGVVHSSYLIHKSILIIRVLRAEEAERGDMLRTKAMRDRDAGVGMRIYHYTIIRIRFPDGILLQG